MARFTVLLRLLAGDDGQLRGQLTDLATGRQWHFADGQTLWQALLDVGGTPGALPLPDAGPSPAVLTENGGTST